MPIEARIKSGYFSVNSTAFRESSKFTPTLTTLTPAFLIRLITSSRSPSYCEKWRWQCESKSFRVDIKDYYLVLLTSYFIPKNLKILRKGVSQCQPVIGRNLWN